LLALGFTGGYRIGSSRVSNLVVETGGLVPERRAETSAGEDQAPADRGFPDVVGLPETDAVATLAGTGLTIDDITVTSKPHAGPPGVVVSQSPAPGSTDVDKAELVVSEEAEMPDLVGKRESAAQETLDALGARVRVERKFVAGRSVGEVYETDPGPGAAVPAEVTLWIAANPASIPLTELEEVESDCSTGEASIGGERFTSALGCSTSTGDTDVMSYAIGRDFERFRATVGVEDLSSTDVPVQIRVKADARVVFDRRIAFGEAVSVDVDVSGALRLTIEVTAIGSDEDDGSAESAVGDPEMLGSPDAVAKYRGPKT
jgi:hypothetical protein